MLAEPFIRYMLYMLYLLYICCTYRNRAYSRLNCRPPQQSWPVHLFFIRLLVVVKVVVQNQHFSAVVDFW